MPFLRFEVLELRSRTRQTDGTSKGTDEREA